MVEQCQHDISSEAVVATSLAEVMAFTTKAILALEQPETSRHELREVMFAMKDLSWVWASVRTGQHGYST